MALSGANLIERIAFTHYYYEFLEDIKDTHNKENLKSALRFWNQMKQGLNEEPWKDGKHYGDCIKVPCICMRCYFDDFYKIAKDISDIDSEYFMEKK